MQDNMQDKPTDCNTKICMNSVVHIDNVEGYKIYDTTVNSYIGFKNPKSSSGKLKSIWHKTNHAKSAFKLHTGIEFNKQTRFKLVSNTLD